MKVVRNVKKALLASDDRMLYLLLCARFMHPNKQSAPFAVALAEQNRRNRKSKLRGNSKNQIKNQKSTQNKNRNQRNSTERKEQIPSHSTAPISPPGPVYSSRRIFAGRASPSPLFCLFFETVPSSTPSISPSLSTSTIPAILP